MDAFEYISVLTSIIIGLGMAQLLLGVSRIIQHPENARPYWVHLSWVLTMFIYSVFWWWWEFNLNEIEVWTFGAYLLVILYAFLVFLMCALLSPVNLSGYDGFEEYYYAKRAWIFGTFLVIQFVDSGVALIKGTDYFLALGVTYFVGAVTHCCLIGDCDGHPKQEFSRSLCSCPAYIPDDSGIPVLRDHLERCENYNETSVSNIGTQSTSSTWE